MRITVLRYGNRAVFDLIKKRTASMRILFLLTSAIIIITGCSAKSENITFTAVVESVYDNGILVTTVDGVDFDKASVWFDNSLMLNFKLQAGQMLKIEILPEIRESYPVQVTAVRIEAIMIVQTAEYKKISAAEAQEMMGEDVIILDVRTQSEFNEGHIPNAILLPYNDITDKAKTILPDMSKTVLVYCRSGRRSELAAKDLIELGYTSVYDFGGIIDWRGDVVIPIVD